MDSPEVPPEKRPSVMSAQALPKPFGFEVASGVEHLLHARAAAGPFVADNHHVTGFHAVF